MQTNLADFMRGNADAERAKEIIGACVHCGFCNATCPTYQILGDERDGPRGRIYLIKQMLEGASPGLSTQTHLDRCLTCRNCETTCPSGVQYSHLIDIGRKLTEEMVPRPWSQKFLRQVMAQVLPRPALVTPLLKAGYLLRPVLSDRLREKLPLLNTETPYLRPKHSKHAKRAKVAAGGHVRRMLLLDGCVQPGMAPNINAATVRVFDALGVQVLRAPKAACCGALRYHLNQQEAALDDMRRNIDAWWPYIELDPFDDKPHDVVPVEAILITASGCGVTVKEYGSLLAHDPAYAEKAARVAGLTRDVSEVLALFGDQLQRKVEEKGLQNSRGNTPKNDHPLDPALPVLAYHPPCTLQHGQQLRGQVEALLRKLGFEVRLPQDSHICCGSAGTYSILQPELSQTLRAKKLANLLANPLTKPPACIVSGNIGCLAHLQSGTELPVRHWIELVDQMLR